MQSLHRLSRCDIKAQASQNTNTYINNVCGNCRFYDSVHNKCNRIPDVVMEDVINKCKEDKLFEPSLKTRLGYASYKKIEL